MNKSVILYSTTTCPKCNILKTKLDEKKVGYTVVDDVDVLVSKNIMSVPVLEVDGVMMDFLKANKWVNEVSD